MDCYLLADTAQSYSTRAQLNAWKVDKSTKLRKFMSKEEREMDNIRLFNNYVLALQKKVEVNEDGQSFIRVTYTRKACGGRRYSIGETSDDMGSSKKISYLYKACTAF